MATDVKKLKDSIVQMDIQIQDYEMRIKGLKADREGMMRELVRIRGSGMVIEVP
jgi:hypothetical protein